MANVKSRLKAPKSATAKKKITRGKVKKSLTGPKEPVVKKNVKECDVVMKRPSNANVMTMTSDEKVQYLLKHGHKLKEKFIVKRPVNVKPNTCSDLPFRHDIRNDTTLPLISKSGLNKNNSNCNTKVIESLKNNEPNIPDNGSNEEPSRIRTPPVLRPARVTTNNNNDNEITDQNSTFEDFSDDGSEYKTNGETDSSDDYSDETNCSDDTMMEKSAAKKKKIEPPKQNMEKQIKQTKHVTLKNGVVLRLACFVCDYCNRTFNRKPSLIRHIDMHLGRRPFICPQCPQTFRHWLKLNIHLKQFHSTNSETELFICNYCDKPYLLKQNLKKHLANHVKFDNSYKCIYCGEVFGYHALLMQHEKQHMVRGRHVCTLCSMSYRDRTRLYLHVKSHLKIKDYVCQYCGKEFLRHSSMTRHVEVNHGGHRIVCPICKKNLKGHLTEHMRTHEKKKPHVCPDCGQRFTQSTQLNVHRRSHTGARPYPCRICKRFFSHSNALMLHIRRHTGEKPFACALCPMTFSQLPHMKTHMRKIHGKENPYKCANCESYYKLKVQLDVHEKTCTAGKAAKKPKDKKKKSKQGEEEIEVESPMTLSRMRFLLALLLTMIASKEKLKFLGFNKRLIDDILAESLVAMSKTPCKDDSLTPLKRLRTNIEMLLIGTVPKDQMEKFKKENKSTEDILVLLTNEKDK